MNEKTLLLLCYLITTVCSLPFRKKLSRRCFAFLILLVPIVIYVLLIILFVVLALIYGDN